MRGARLVLLRHGRTTWNAVGRWQGQADAPLDDVGRAQAQAAAPVLASLAPASVTSSDLSRARDTAAPLASAAAVALATDPRLREVDVGRWEGLTREEIVDRYPREWRTWSQGGSDAARGGGETMGDVGRRVGSALEDVAAGLDDGATAVVVTHGAAARAGLGTLLALPVDTWWRLHPLRNCAWATLERDPRGWRLVHHGVGVEHSGTVGGAAVAGGPPAQEAGRLP